MNQGLPWIEAAETLFRRKWTIALTLLGTLLLTGIWIRSSPARYKATTRIQLTAGPEGGPRDQGMDDRQIQAELAFLKSANLIGRVLQDLDEASEEGDAVPAVPASPVSGPQGVRRFLAALRSRISPESEEDSFNRRVQAIAQAIEVNPVGRTNIVEISYTSRSPERAAYLVNELLIHHVERIGELGQGSPQLAFFQDQLEVLAARWRAARRQLDDYRAANSESVMEGDEDELRGVVGGLESSRVGAETRVLELKAAVEFLQRQMIEYPETVEAELRVTQNESVRFLENRLLDLEVERTEALSKYTPTSTIVRDLDRQIERTEQLLAAEEKQSLTETMTSRNPAFQAIEVELLRTQAQLTTEEAKVQALSSQIDSYRGKLNRLEQTIVAMEQLESEVDNARDAYDTYLKMAETARIDVARGEFGLVNIAVVEPADIPAIPEPSRDRLKLVVSAFLGLFLGIGLAFVRDWIDPSVKSAIQVSRLTGLPIIAEVPIR